MCYAACVGNDDVRIDVLSETESEAEVTDGEEGAESGKWLYERLWDAVWIHPKEVSPSSFNI